MSNTTPPPAPDASKRLNAPAPSGAPLNAPPPPPVVPAEKVKAAPKVEETTEKSKPVDNPVVSISTSIPTAEVTSGFKGFIEKRFRGVALSLSILTFFLNVIPFIGVLFAGFSLYFAIRGEQRAQGKKKMLVWAIVLSSLGAMSSLGMTMSFLGYMGA